MLESSVSLSDSLVEFLGRPRALKLMVCHRNLTAAGFLSSTKDLSIVYETWRCDTSKKS